MEGGPEVSGCGLACKLFDNLGGQSPKSPGVRARTPKHKLNSEQGRRRDYPEHGPSTGAGNDWNSQDPRTQIIGL